MQNTSNFSITFFIKRNVGCTNPKIDKELLNLQTAKGAKNRHIGICQN
jgi:hypothetical protein